MDRYEEEESDFNCDFTLFITQNVSIYKVHSKPPAYREGELPAVLNSKTIMISGTIHDLSDVELLEHFLQFGYPSNVIRKIDPKDPRKFQRFAFVRFDDVESADAASAQVLQTIKGQYVDVRRVKDV